MLISGRLIIKKNNKKYKREVKLNLVLLHAFSYCLGKFFTFSNAMINGGAFF